MSDKELEALVAAILWGISRAASDRCMRYYDETKIKACDAVDTIIGDVDAAVVIKDMRAILENDE